MAFQHNAFQHNALNVAVPSNLLPFVSLGFFLPLSVPVRRLPRPAEFRPVFWNSMEFSYETSWFTPLSLPVRPARPVPIRELQQANAAALFNIDPHWPQWIQPLSIPVRRREAPQAVTNRPDGLGLVPEVSFGWWAEMNQPVRRPPRLAEGKQSHLHFALLEPVTAMRWHMPLSLPVRPKDSRHIFDRFVVGRPPLVPFGWYVEMNQAPRKEQPHPARQHHTGAVYSATLHPLIFTDWFWPLSLPVRRDETWDYQRLADPFQFGAFLQVQPMDWLMEMSLPVRPKLELGAHQQPSENTVYFVGNLPFRSTGPLYLNGRHINGGQTIWRGRTRK